MEKAEGGYPVSECQLSAKDIFAVAFISITDAAWIVVLQPGAAIRAKQAVGSELVHQQWRHRPLMATKPAAEQTAMHNEGGGSAHPGTGGRHYRQRVKLCHKFGGGERSFSGVPEPSFVPSTTSEWARYRRRVEA